jgi:hypothetical protein
VKRVQSLLVLFPGGRDISTAFFYYRMGALLFKEEDPEAAEADGPRGGAETEAAADENGKDAPGEPDKIQGGFYRHAGA